MKYILAILILVLCANSVVAQHPIDVERLVAEQKDFEAITLFQKLPRRQIKSSTLVAVSKSAWILGLSEKASEYLNLALQDEELTEVERSKIIYQQALIEFQESRYREAAILIKKSLNLLQEPSPLRGLVLMLAGDTANKLNAPADVLKYYKQAADEISHDLIAEVNFRLATVAKEKGEFDEAIKLFRKLPLEHKRSAEAIRSMAEIAIDNNNPQLAANFLQKGRELYPDEFIDSWVDYVLTNAAISGGETSVVRNRRSEALTKYPASDEWITLLDATAEVYEWTEEARK